MNHGEMDDSHGGSGGMVVPSKSSGVESHLYKRGACLEGWIGVVVTLKLFLNYVELNSTCLSFFRVNYGRPSNSYLNLEFFKQVYLNTSILCNYVHIFQIPNSYKLGQKVDVSWNWYVHLCDFRQIKSSVYRILMLFKQAKSIFLFQIQEKVLKLLN